MCWLVEESRQIVLDSCLCYLPARRQEVEMALGPTSITEAREKAIDFTVPFDYEPWDILIPESIVTVDLTAYLFPFAGLVSW